MGDHGHLRDHDHEAFDPLKWLPTEDMQRQIDE